MRTSVSAFLRLMAGGEPLLPRFTTSPRELFSTSTIILIFVESGPSGSLMTVGVTSSFRSASLNWIWVPAELTVAYGSSSPSEIAALLFSIVTISGRARVRVLPRVARA